MRNNNNDSGRKDRSASGHDVARDKSRDATPPGFEPSGSPLVERRKGDRRRLKTDAGSWRSIELTSGPGLWINLLSKEVVIDGDKVPLTPKEFDLLCLLASQPGRVFSDDEILDSLWGDSDSATTAHVAQYVHRLRKKLGDDPLNPYCLINVKRFGYKLHSPLEPDVPSPDSQ